MGRLVITPTGVGPELDVSDTNAVQHGRTTVVVRGGQPHTVRDGTYQNNDTDE